MEQREDTERKEGKGIKHRKESESSINGSNVELKRGNLLSW